MLFADYLHPVLSQLANTPAALLTLGQIPLEHAIRALVVEHLLLHSILILHFHCCLIHSHCNLMFVVTIRIIIESRSIAIIIIISTSS